MLRIIVPPSIRSFSASLVPNTRPLIARPGSIVVISLAFAGIVTNGVSLLHPI
jgi:hypothetical protein